MTHKQLLPIVLRNIDKIDNLRKKLSSCYTYKKRCLETYKNLKKIFAQLKTQVFNTDLSINDVFHLVGCEFNRKVNILDFEISLIKDILRSQNTTIHESNEIFIPIDKNFEHLNTDELHPSRNYRDTFYYKDCVLRTHTSSEQDSMLKKIKNFQINSVYHLGPVYRNDFSSRHLPKFHQLEILCTKMPLTKYISMWINILSTYLGFPISKKINILKAYFPFVSLGLEVYINEVEVLGLGITSTNITSKQDISYRVNAGGLGIERLIMLKYGMKQISELYK